MEKVFTSKMLKTLIIVFLSFFIIHCDEVDEVLYGEEAGNSEPVSGTDAPFVPEDVSNMLMWLDASDESTLFMNSSCTTPATTDGAGIGCWLDKSGNNKNAIQTNNSREPELDLSAQNGLNAIWFPGSGDKTLDVTSANWQPSNKFTAFIVYFQDNADTLGILFGTYPNAAADFMLVSTTYTSNRYKYYDFNKWLSGSSYSAGDWIIDTYHRDGSSMNLYQNGILDASMNGLNSASAGAARIGAYTNTSYSNLYHGHIAEIVWFADTLSSEDRLKMEGYLAHKWGRTLALEAGHPYKNDPPTTFTPDP